MTVRASEFLNEDDDQLDEQLMYRGYACRKDCGGHTAGYEWARSLKLTSPDQCPYRPSHPSFYEGCLSYFNAT